MTGWVVFDHGKVLSRPTAALPRLAEVLGADLQPFRSAYFALRPGYDRGCDPLEYWRSVGERVGARVDAELAAELTGIDNAGWLELDPASLRLVEDLRRREVPMAVLSNAPASFGREVEKQAWAEAFELVFSGNLRLAKPEPEIYEHLMRLLGASASECIFFDDTQDNVAWPRSWGCARSCGGAPNAPATACCDGASSAEQAAAQVEPALRPCEVKPSFAAITSWSRQRRQAPRRRSSH